jgi:hypothetical protein
VPSRRGLQGLECARHASNYDAGRTRRGIDAARDGGQRLGDAGNGARIRADPGNKRGSCHRQHAFGRERGHAPFNAIYCATKHAALAVTDAEGYIDTDMAAEHCGGSQPLVAHRVRWQVVDTLGWTQIDSGDDLQRNLVDLAVAGAQIRSEPLGAGVRLSSPLAPLGQSSWR